MTITAPGVRERARSFKAVEEVQSARQRCTRSSEGGEGQCTVCFREIMISSGTGAEDETGFGQTCLPAALFLGLLCADTGG